MQFRVGRLMIAALIIGSACSKKSKPGSIPSPNPNPVPPVVKSDIAFWLTEPDQTSLFTKQSTPLLFSASTNSNLPAIEVDSTQVFQTIDGFGYTLTGGSATLINQLPAMEKQALLEELFRADSSNIGVSYLRISIGASDLSSTSFTYNDIPAGETDLNLTRFTIDKEKQDLIPVLKKIIAINPTIKILGSPWTAPVWMKTSNGFVGGSLKPEYYSVYANYFVKYIQAMAAEGITVDAITIQNEPLHGGNNPSMEMQAAEQALFIKNHLGPAFAAQSITTKIIVYDHNADRPDYPLAILDDEKARPYVDGSAFHLYAGNISALSQVHNRYPGKHVYFTEQWTGGPGNFAGDFKWHMQNLIIGATRNWSKNVLEWNLASDPSYLPHTPGGCTSCMGALTIGGGVRRNVSYYVIAHASKMVRPGSVRIESSQTPNLQTVAFRNPEGKKILIVLNSGNNTESFNIRFNQKSVTTSLKSGAAGTYAW